MFRSRLNTEKITADFGSESLDKFKYIQNWLRKRSAGSFPGYERYTYYWIAFNVFYDLKYFKQHPGTSNWDTREYDRVKNVLNNLSQDQLDIVYDRAFFDVVDYLDVLRGFTLKGKPDRFGVSTDLIALLFSADSNKHNDRLERLLRCLYAIRCNLFHGDKQPNDVNQNRLLLKSSAVLRNLLTVFLEPYFLDK